MPGWATLIIKTDVCLLGSIKVNEMANILTLVVRKVYGI